VSFADTVCAAVSIIGLHVSPDYSREVTNGEKWPVIDGIHLHRLARGGIPLDANEQGTVNLSICETASADKYE
jgi:hypothetical protein